MSKWPASWRIILLLILCGVWSGCLPSADTPVDEEKDPNYIEGKNYRNAMDYKSAIDAFERAVQANPRNAAAHFELGVLYEQNVHDFISALYHFQKHLDLRPKSEYKDAIEPRMKTCKLELAKSVTFGVVTADVHRDLVKLTNELGVLRQQSDALRAQLAAKPTVVTQWMTLRVTNFLNVTQRVMVAAPPAPVPATPIATSNVPARPLITPATRTNTAPRTNATTRPAPVAPAPSPLTQTTISVPARTQRTHKVQTGENMSEIAKRYGISTQKLQEANRSVDPRRMHAGQTLIIP